MDAEAIEREDWPAGPVALATALSGFPAVLLFAALYGPELLQTEPREMLGTSAMLVFASLAPACFVGIPIALLLLRNPGRRVWVWAMAGAATATIAVTMVGFWSFGISFAWMIFTVVGEVLFLVYLAAAVIGAVCGLIARLLLWWFAGIRGS